MIYGFTIGIMGKAKGYMHLRYGSKIINKHDLAIFDLLAQYRRYL
jgi:Xaa-Pro aminopeptidase